MRKSILPSLGALLAAGVCLAQTPVPTHGYMHPDSETLRLWQEEDRRMPRAEFRPLDASGKALAGAALPAKADVLSLLSYVPSERQQGSCGDCWVWGSTAMTEVALAAQYGLKDRLSVQFLNSTRTSAFACDGGTLNKFTAWYNTQKVLIPWSNPKGEFRDATVNDYCTQSLVDPSVIGRTPSYALVSMTPYVIDSQQTQDQMIDAIKTALVNQKAVGLSYYTDFDSADGFNAFWDGQDETVLWVNAYEGKAWDAKTWGGHMVTVVGYNAEDADPAKHYWIVLNSWGSSTKRPTGFFRMPMRMNYQATYTDTDGKPYTCYAFKTLDLTVTPAAPAAPTVQVALSNQAPAVGQPLTLTAQVAGTPPFTYQWRKNGTAIAGACAAELVLPFLTTSDGGQTYDVVVGNSVSQQTSAPVVFSVAGQNLLLNPGMEDTSGWTATSSLVGLSPWRIGSAYAALAHSGSGYAYLGGAKSDGTIDSTCTFTQKVQVPNQSGSLTLSYWMRSSTAEKKTNTAATDTLTISVLDDGGTTLQTLKTHSNLDVDHLLWKRESFDLGAYKGRTIQIQARTTQDAQNYTAFRLDDIGLVLVPPAQSLVLSPKQTTRLGGSAVTFTAQVSNSTGNQVNWTVSGGSLAQATTTAASATNAWTLPLVSGTYSLNATLQENPLATDTATVQVIADADIALALSPLSSTMVPGQSRTLTASGDGGGGITWTGDAPLTVTPAGLQATVAMPAGAPLQTRTLKVKAASSVNAARFLECAITVKSMDFNLDGTVDARDLLVLAKNWNQDSSNPCNLKGAGIVDDTDLAALLSQLP
jgi:hypothetical protein